MKRKSRLRHQSIQQDLTPEQTAEAEATAERFDDAYIQAQLSIEPVDEHKAETFLRQAYRAVGLPPPSAICWLDGPLQLVALLAGERTWLHIEDSVKDSIPGRIWDSVKDSDEIGHIEDGKGVIYSVDYRVSRAQIRAGSSGIRLNVWDLVRERVGWSIWQGLGDSVHWSVGPLIRATGWGNEDYSLWHSIRAYDEAAGMAGAQFDDAYVAPHHQARGLTHFNQLVSGYWLGKEMALVVRRPRLLTRDEAGRLHSEVGKCIEYHDGWGFFAWHGVRVPEEVIFYPEYLMRQDWSTARNAEVRRVIQERMGERFMPEVGGKYIDGGPHGVLYEVALPEDPERVARYVQVQDTSSSRYYFLRVPPTIQTAAEAVAWSFGLSIEEYDPIQET
jgi:hypothetical protein